MVGDGGENGRCQEVCNGSLGRVRISFLVKREKTVQMPAGNERVNMTVQSQGKREVV